MNLEGIRILEVPEQHIEKKSMTITENNAIDSEDTDFSNCAKTPEEKIHDLKSLKEEILNYSDYSKTGQVQTDKIKDNFEDCRKR